ncbi:bifunctional DNA-formamidopyrimidine glycosylase/DNA-(apurinic or apyrimidinic site) lyase [Acetonema longum]|uniref:Formamidopyrimidine-DNA glycosylase n=1 Tax=Acetonema longum DSM 6540 TaxID=1009370 RepID=F7NDW6_9FIRM|nr:bifunctional DNA-formamidopyrimidine glycosylase/DNA-(apurinic or apyrimidinic site) lyase [Acetonema longum]EGO65781.1 formamidopyrimidine-DNA glycosylase [Acetonema longum DSM 6540]
MPELPEVETIRRNLESHIVDKQITAVDIFLPRLVKWPSADEFRARVLKKKINRLERKGKYLLLRLQGDITLIIHLRMTGQLYIAEAGHVTDRFERIRLHLDSEEVLVYSDARTLGTWYVMPDHELGRVHGLESLGPEPLSEPFTVSYLAAIFRSRTGKIKSLLLNQELIGGLGNIYADESLALAGIYPERPANSLNSDELEALHQAINTVISQALQNAGTTFRDYRNGYRQEGHNQHHLRVYGRKGQACPICGSTIVRIETAGRGTHYCPQCQH